MRASTPTRVVRGKNFYLAPRVGLDRDQACYANVSWVNVREAYTICEEEEDIDYVHNVHTARNGL